MLELTLIGGPTALLQYGGLRWLTDPTFSAPGAYNHLTKTTGPAIESSDIEPVDVVLLSHEHHADNLDPHGRAFLPRAGRVLTTGEGAERLGGNATGLEPWSSVQVPRNGTGPVTVTAVPAEHGPEGIHELTGPVIGFVLSSDEAPAIYVSGDNASIEVVRSVADRLGPIEVAVLFAGAAQVPARYADANLTFSSDQAAEAAGVLGVRAAIPLHYEGWAHFTQDADTLRAAFGRRGILDRLVLARRGQAVSV